jgi:hypothetical protein
MQKILIEAVEMQNILDKAVEMQNLFAFEVCVLTPVRVRLICVCRLLRADSCADSCAWFVPWFVPDCITLDLPRT